MQAVAALQEKGVVIQSIICDGKSGLLGAFPDIPVQMCQFHQIKIGVMDKIGVKNRCSPYAARLYKRSKPLNTKNAFFAAQNRSGKMAPKVANNAIDACPVTSVSAVGKS